jgi:hypothetical protein
MLEPDDSGAHLWAVFLDDEVSRISLLYDSTDELLDAQAVATLAAFARAEADRRVGNSGSGGPLCEFPTIASSLIWHGENYGSGGALPPKLTEQVQLGRAA